VGEKPSGGKPKDEYQHGLTIVAGILPRKYLEGTGCMSL